MGRRIRPPLALKLRVRRGRARVKKTQNSRGNFRDTVHSLSVEKSLALPLVGKFDTVEKLAIPFASSHVQWIRGVDDVKWGEIRSTPERYHFTFYGLASFSVSRAMDQDCPPSLGECYVQRLSSVDDETVSHLWSNQVVPFVWSVLDFASLHVSAVAFGRKAVALAGTSGAGKSTLALALLRQGGRLLSDDGLRVRYADHLCLAWPGSSKVRLWSDSAEALQVSGLRKVPGNVYSEKSHFVLEADVHLESDVVPLCRILLLQSGERCCQIRTDPVAPAVAFRELARHSFVLDSTSLRCSSIHFDTLSRLASSGAIWRLSYPRSFERLPEVAAAVRLFLDGAP